MVHSTDYSYGTQHRLMKKCGYVSNIVCTVLPDLLPWVHITLCFCYLTCTCMQDKMTPVFMAAQNGHVEALSLLISAGADVNLARKVSYSNIFYQ